MGKYNGDQEKGIRIYKCTRCPRHVVKRVVMYHPLNQDPAKRVRESKVGRSQINEGIHKVF